MRTIFFSLLFILVSFSVFANEPIPKVVEAAFSSLYPDVQTPFWEKREGLVVATFNSAEGLTKVFFREDGRKLETRIRLPLEEMPGAVSRFVRENYRHADITFAGKVYRDSAIVYRIESELPTEIVIKELDEKGQLLKATQIALDMPILQKKEEVDLLPKRSVAPIIRSNRL